MKTLDEMYTEMHEIEEEIKQKELRNKQAKQELRAESRKKIVQDRLAEQHRVDTASAIKWIIVAGVLSALVGYFFARMF